MWILLRIFASLLFLVGIGMLLSFVVYEATGMLVGAILVLAAGILVESQVGKYR